MLTASAVMRSTLHSTGRNRLPGVRRRSRRSRANPAAGRWASLPACTCGSGSKITGTVKPTLTRLRPAWIAPSSNPCGTWAGNHLSGSGAVPALAWAS